MDGQILGLCGVTAKASARLVNAIPVTNSIPGPFTRSWRPSLLLVLFRKCQLGSVREAIAECCRCVYRTIPVSLFEVLLSQRTQLLPIDRQKIKSID